VVVLANVDGAFAASFASGQWDAIVDAELRDRRALGFPPATRAISISGTIDDVTSMRALPEMKGHRILGPAPAGKGHRIVVLADYATAPTVIAAVRAHVIASKTTSTRVHCDDLDVFDEVDSD
jgi:primosomal protein N' (replication factor Y)